MASWHGRPGHDRKLDRFVNFVSTKLVSGANLAPQGRLRNAQGASPGNKDSNNGSPEGAMQWVPVPKTCLMTSIHLELRQNSAGAAHSRLSAIWTLNQGLARCAVLLDPF